MPLNGHHHLHCPTGNAQDAPPTNPSAAGGVLQASQVLGSVGAPIANLRVTPSTTTSSGSDLLYFSNDRSTGPNSGSDQADTRFACLPGVEAGDTSLRSTTSASAMAEPSQAFNGGPRRQQTFPRQPEELHIPAAGNSLASNGPRPGQNQFPSASDYGAPSINIQQPSQFPSGAGNNTTSLPGALQPGPGNRPGPSNTTAPPSIQMLPHLATQPLSPNTPTKSGQSSQQQAFSRSSPSSAFDQQKYKQVGSTPDSGKYMSPTSGTYAAQTPQASSPYSPLGLADIRPHIDSAMLEATGSTVAGGNSADIAYPTNSNYIAPWAVYALDWCKWPAPPGGSSFGKIALGSYLEDSHNYIQILSAQRASSDVPESPDGNPGLEFIKTAEATHSYPVTRILWEPPSSQKQSTDLLATSGDHLRLWSLPTDSHSQSYMSNSINRSSKSRNQPIQKLSPLALLSNSKSPEHTAPITSLDWNVVSPSLIITSSIDTTCTIWDIPTLTAKTQLIAHDKEVYDVRFCANSVDVFVSCGADGSVRMFDLRSLEHSTIIYEPSEKTEKLTNSGNLTPPSHNNPWPPPLLRIAASPHDAHLLGTFSQDSNIIRILDVRQPGQALLELKGHGGPINCIEWSPTRRGTIASGADDCLVLVWDLINQSNAAAFPPAPPPPNHTGSSNGPATVERGPAAAWQCDYEVSNISWAPHASGGMSGAPGVGRDWVGVCGGRGLWGVSI
ncbi:WD repeat-containing protein 68 [Blastomyces parvus]|uniref:WD repeat-containing protein 68 n=1 Tax=Blastomyces parvus TaxID=2060905 RepID=A0A2B7XNT0_9EURO|nr:WD repeat-containing protein 68 [Blastomyces parvus]